MEVKLGHQPSSLTVLALTHQASHSLLTGVLFAQLRRELALKESKLAPSRSFDLHGDLNWQDSVPTLFLELTARGGSVALPATTLFSVYKVILYPVCLLS